jgi:hypothetical protein
MTDITTAGTLETYKLSIHLAMFGLSSICLAYNVGRCFDCGTHRNHVSTVVYTALMIFEALQVKNHALGAHETRRELQVVA